jgi:hypothetical protein
MVAGCEKEIAVDYHTVEPLYVVEAALTGEQTLVHVTQTNDMSDNTSHTVANAQVTITADDGTTATAAYVSDGYYRATMGGVAGHSYRLDVEVGGQHFSSTSSMQRQPVVSSFRMVWQNMFATRLLFGEVIVDDFPNEENYYYIHVYRNGYGYRWTVFRDTGNPGQELKQLFACCAEDDVDSSNDLGATDVICENDKLYIEVRAIDRRSYDYLASMQTMDSAGTNPIANFTGGCLGYFSAYSPVAIDYVFHRADVQQSE